MIKLENTVLPSADQWKAIIFGARNPLNSWDRSDSEFDREATNYFDENDILCTDLQTFIIGSNDFDLMKRLRGAGTDHRKFMRMITVYVDITAPFYWWKEFDTYKVGTVANSCSTMHKIAAKEFTLEDFSCEHLMSFDNSNYWEEDSDNACFIDPGKKEVVVPMSLILNYIIPMLNVARDKYNEASKKLKRTDLTEAERKHVMAQKKLFWWQMIQLLPSSYNQKRTVMLNYEVLANIYKSRKTHKLDEWREFCAWIETLPYSELITGASLKDIPICNEIMDEAKKRVINKEVQ